MAQMKFIELGPKPPMGPPPPETRETLIFLFYSLYTSMVTKNKFFTFLARLSPPGSRTNYVGMDMYVRRREEGEELADILEIEVPDPRLRGRSRKKWIDNIIEDMTAFGLQERMPKMETNGELL